MQIDLPVTDETFVADLRIALCHLHGRLAERIGTTGDMQQDTALAHQMIDVQAAYDELPE